MKILILSTTKSSSGGVERFSFYLEKSFRKEGHTVSIVSREDVGIFEQKLLLLSKYFGMQQPLLGYFLGKKVIKEGFDICVTNGMLGWNIKKRMVLNVQHGTFAKAAERIDKNKNFFKFLVKRYLWGTFEGLAARRAKYCVAVSEETKQSVEKYYQAKDVRVILNGVDTTFFKKEDKISAREKLGLPLDKNILLFVGRFEYGKGQSVLAGIQKRIDELNGMMIIAETFSQEELVSLYNASDVFLLPSLHEGCSYALLDAMSVGLPFVASPVGLVSAFYKKNMFSECVVVEQNVEAYMQKIKFIIGMTQVEKDSLTAKIQEYIINFHTINHCDEEYNKLLKL